MAISSVSSSSNAAQQAQVIQANKAAEEPVKAREVPRQEQEQKPEPPKPVINTQGESTGQVINTTA